MTKAGGKHHNGSPEQLRPARMRIETTVLMSGAPVGLGF